jgi:aryl-alcohol dehydrogenase-like predicted oxidoreductase
MKIAIGTAQLGMPYGISNVHGQTSIEEAAKIIGLARERGINTIDTAIAYGDSEQRLGQIGISGFLLISKLPAVPPEISNIKDWILKSVEGSLFRLHQPLLHCLLLHRPDQLLEKIGLELYEALAILKEQGLVNKIGISIYNPYQLEPILNCFSFDVVQSPISILDRRILESGWAEKLNERGIELHGRSVFLQGLLLMPSLHRPSYFQKWADLWARFDAWVAESGKTALELALGYVLANNHISRAVVGVENQTQLIAILDAAEQIAHQIPFHIESIEESLVNPALWYGNE